MKTLELDERQTPDDYEFSAQVMEALALYAPSDEPICHLCRHLSTEGGMRCAAFPGGIPWEIQAGEWDHRLPHPGDRGIRYEALTPEEFRERAAALRARGRALAARGAAD